MTIINESQADYHKKIGSCLQQCAPDQRTMNIPEIIKLKSLSIRDLAWMIAILEKPYQYVAIPWRDPLLRKRVDVLHNCFLTKIERDAAEHAEKDEFKSLPYDVRLTAIHQFMGVTWEMAHDYKGKAITTYMMNFDTEQDSFNTTLIGVITASGAKKSDTEENYIPIGLPATSSSISKEQRKIWEAMQLPMMPWNIQHNKVVRTEQIMQLLRDICVEKPLRIDLDKLVKLETINSYNLAFVIAICLKGYETRIKVNFSDLTIGSEVLSIHSEMWNILDEEIHRPENKFKYTDDVDMRRDQTFKLLSVSLLPEQARLWIEKKYLDATASPLHQRAQLPEDLPEKYTDTAVNVAVVQTILPKKLPDKNSKLNKDKKRALGWECFLGLKETLQANGCKIINSLTEVVKKTEASLSFIDEFDEEIHITYDSFRHTFKILLSAYLYDLPIDKKRF
ncbi:hypothetical protein Lnau_1516 [Legionella nautarum]|uniref:Uncharacterized protein n=1 Tax=Legionella nautarum TaxID=45070 RepID=A0A0W0WW94_9GAMM|nr:hypothetical protein [Legionella nautarum]KTD36532.1 hypothetical protein Lnau_1516 [Legionella nautarum]